LSAFARLIWGLLRDAGVFILLGQNRNRKPTGMGQLGKNFVEEQVSYVHKKGRTHQSEEQHDHGRPPEDQRECKPDRICKSDGIEESNRVVNPKAPSMPQTTQAILPPVPPSDDQDPPNRKPQRKTETPWRKEGTSRQPGAIAPPEYRTKGKRE
jgi:hypothetical protein